MAEFSMPSLGAEMTEGKLVEWLVHPGDTVKRGDVIAVVETDKAALEVEVWQDGVVEELLIAEGLKVPVGTVLARLGDVGAAVPPVPEPVPEAVPGPAPAPVPVPVPAPVPTPAPAVVPSPVAVGAGAGNGHGPQVRGPIARHRAEELGVDLRAVQGTGPGGAITRHDVEEAARVPRRPRVSPFARRLAQERGVDVTGLVGSGPGGAVVAADVPTQAPADVAAVAPAPQSPAEAMRAAIARAMARSKREIPHYYLGTQVDLTDALAWLDERNADRPPAERVLPAVVELKAVALALRDHPDLNGFWVDDGFRPGETIDLGVAIALRGGGLVAPAIRQTDTLDLDALMAALRDLVRRCRSGRMRASEATSATLTVTNLGDLGVETVHGVIYPPQVALVGFGRPVQRPWVVDGAVAVRTVVDLTLAADHRQTDGHLGARFLARVAELLRTPEEL
jgi:pyruvate dehydrogenase E2 component (dihydrolipoamide acetyltransferase)